MNRLDIALVTGFFITTLVFGVVVHESTHVSVFNSYGCEPEVNWIDMENKGVLASVSADCPDSMTKNEKLSLFNAQQNVEASGYQLIPLYGLAGFILGLMVIVYTRLEVNNSL